MLAYLGAPDLVAHQQEVHRLNLPKHGLMAHFRGVGRASECGLMRLTRQFARNVNDLLDTNNDGKVDRHDLFPMSKQAPAAAPAPATAPAPSSGAAGDVKAGGTFEA